jgi:outer membrane receptor protein involved in Fe transport
LLGDLTLTQQSLEAGWTSASARLWRGFRQVLPAVVAGTLALPPGAAAQGSSSGSSQQPSGQALPQPTFDVTVIGATPLEGMELNLNQIPAPVQGATAREIEQSGALDLADFLNKRANGVYVNEIQNNPFQPDLNYRGYTASPLLGTPQGLSIYLDGVRLNQPFGEVVSWDLIPRLAISTSILMPGSNPLFGLNTLGGALALHTKDGTTAPGTSVRALYGSDARAEIEFEHGGSRGSGVNWYLTGNLFTEDGWRDASPSDVRQLFGKVGWRRPTSDLAISVAFADNVLNGNALQEVGFLERDFASVYTKPDETDNRGTFLNVTTRRQTSERVTISANGYYRDIRTNTLNGDINEDSLDQALYQPNAVERAALAAAGYTGFPVSGEDASNTPFPFWRCVANVLLEDEPAEKCNGLINRTRSVQQNGGASGQLTLRDGGNSRMNHFTAGGAFDRSGVSFEQSTELGYLNPDRSITGTGAFGDGETGGDVDGEPYDTRVDLDGTVQTWSLFATDTLTLGAWNLTGSVRYNRTSVDNRDQVQPGGGPGSLDGEHRFDRLNPAVGVTVSPSSTLNLYAGYNEGSRAPTSIELGCADPEEPCKLPNAMAGDPPLEQVVTRTFEGGVRGTYKGLRWNAGAFRAANTDDILFVMSEQTGFGYFRNFGETLRRGLELGAQARAGRVAVGGGYTFLNATYETEETVNGESNSTNDSAEDGVPGVEGSIEIEPGDRMPLIPRHMVKAFADIDVTSKVSVDLNLVGISSSYARGNENNLHEPDGTYYLGDGSAAGYAVVSLGARYQVLRWLALIGQINNLFDAEYFTGGQLGPNGFTDTGAFIARPFPPVNGEFPVRQSTFLAPGAPIRAWFGTQFKF